MMERWYIGCLLVFMLWQQGRSQDNPIRLDLLQYEQLERLMTKYSDESILFPSFHNVSRRKMAEYVMSLPFSSLSEGDLDVVRSMVNDSPEWFTDTAFLAKYSSVGQPLPSILTPQKNKPWLNIFYPYPGE